MLNVSIVSRLTSLDSSAAFACLIQDYKDFSRIGSRTMVFHGQDAWRRHPLFQNLWKDPLPGFRPAVIAFGVYLGVEYLYKSATMTRRVEGGHKH